MYIIPAIDLIGGKCVRLSQGDYSSKKEYHDDPLEMAKRFEGVGIQRLHLVDLDGAKAKKIVNGAVLERICAETSLQVDFGGGIQADGEIEKAFSLGAKQVTGGSIAVKNPVIFDEWISKYGSEKIILGADAKNKMIAVGGWEETTSVDLIPFIKSYVAKGIRYVICTDVAKDGLLQGPSVEL
jgi:phosphoribosylformimino-5-aminoimidazole carboxamide ribotide isomerase